MQAHPRRTRWLWIAVLAMMIVPGALSLLYLRTAPHKPIDSIAVLPFAFPEGDADAAALSNAITGQLTSGLALIPNLTVTARDSAARYAGKQTDAKTAGHQLGARAVVMGEIERQGGILLVRAELRDAGDNGVIWSQQYSLRSSEVAARQNELIRAIQQDIRFH